MSGPTLEISIPCSSCSTALRFGERACSSCGAVVPRATQKALERRLEFASADFRTLKSHVTAASAILLVIAAAYLFLGLLLYHLDTDTTLAGLNASELASARLDLVSNLLVAVAMVACVIGARRAPVAALTTALIIWVGIEAATLAYAGIESMGIGSIRVLTAKVLTFALLLRGVVSAAIAARLRAKLAPVRRAPLPTARVVS